MGRLLEVGAGVLFTFLWFNGAVAFCAIYVYPVCLILLINPYLYRKLFHCLNTLAEFYIGFLTYLMNIKLVLSGDRISNTESAILIMNHRTTTDWNFFVSMSHQNLHSFVHDVKYIAKDPIRHIPLVGWALQMNGSIFLSRHWEEDQSRLVFTLGHTVSTLRKKIHLLLFPEGTVFDNVGKAKSNAYAEVNGLPKYNHVLHPKTTGFCFLTDFLRKEKALDAIYDITMGFPDKVAEKEWDYFKGNLSKEVHLHIERIAESELPRDKEDLEIWLKKRWMDKEKRLEEFYKNNRFSDKCWPDTRRWVLHSVAAYYFFLILLTYTLLILSPLFRLMTFLQCMFFVGLSFSKFNFTHLEVAYYKFWEKNIRDKLI